MAKTRTRTQEPPKPALYYSNTWAEPWRHVDLGYPAIHVHSSFAPRGCRHGTPLALPPGRKPLSLRQCRLREYISRLREAQSRIRPGCEHTVEYIEQSALAAEARAELARLEGMTDEAYDAEAASIPLNDTAWGLGNAEIVYHAGRRGIQRCYYNRRFEDFGRVSAGMRGYTWCWAATGEPLSRDEVDRHLGNLDIHDPMIRA